MLKYIPSDAKRILDVGCGEGNFGCFLKEKNASEVWGIEIVEEAGKIAKGKLDKVLIGDVNSVINDLPDNFFDCIVLNDVLEHLENPEKVLKIIAKNLTTDGFIIASIPNVRYIWNLVELVFKKDWEYKNSGILDKTHLRFFTQKSIVRMFNNAGYEVKKIEGINPTKNEKVKIFLFLTLGFFRDTRFIQFATVAQKHRL